MENKKLTSVQKIGFISMMAAYADEAICSEALTDCGKSVAADWMDLTENDQEDLRKLALKGLKLLKELSEQNL